MTDTTPAEEHTIHVMLPPGLIENTYKSAWQEAIKTVVNWHCEQGAPLVAAALEHDLELHLNDDDPLLRANATFELREQELKATIDRLEREAEDTNRRIAAWVRRLHNKVPMDIVADGIEAGEYLSDWTTND